MVQPHSSFLYYCLLFILLPSTLSQPLTTLFSSCYTQGCYPTCYRQPIFLVLDSLNLIVFAEGRNNTYCSGTSDGYPSSIRLRRSTDGGITWTSPDQVLYTGNCDFLASVHDYTNQRTHLFVQAPPTGVLYTSSDDKGVTWTSPLKPLEIAPMGYSITPSVAHGIQIKAEYCTEPTCDGMVGRLIVPFVCHRKDSSGSMSSVGVGSDIACPGCFTCLAVSDDHGSTWSIRAVTKQEGSREASLVQLRSSSYHTTHPVIYATERNLSNMTGYRLHTISLDGGNTFSIFGEDKELPDSKVTNWTGIVAGAARVMKSMIVLTTPMKKTERADMGIFVSRDEAMTWSEGRLYKAGPAGYSDTYQLNATHVGIVFENGEDEFAQRISFGTFEL